MEGLHWVTLFSGHFVSNNFDPKWTPNPPFPVLSAAFAKLSPCDSMILAKRIIQRAKLLAVFEKSPPCPGFVDLLFETLRSLALALSEKTSWKFGSIRNCCPKSPGPQQTLDHVPCLDQRTPSKHEVLNLVLSSPNDEFIRTKTWGRKTDPGHQLWEDNRDPIELKNSENRCGALFGIQQTMGLGGSSTYSSQTICATFGTSRTFPIISHHIRPVAEIM